MSVVTGLGVTFWDRYLPGLVNTLQDANTAAGVSNCLLYLADENFTITHIVIANNDPTLTVKAKLAKTAGGVATAANDFSAIQTWSLDPGQTFDWGTRIPFRSGQGLIGMINVGTADLYCGIEGEVSD